MSLRFVPIEEIAEAHLRALIQDGVAEGRDIDYKLALPGTSADDKKEFLADISSFANAGGGDLVFGVDESAGLPTVVRGLADDLDDAMLRLESSIRDGVAPRIQGVRSHPVPLSSGKGALVLRVPRSFARPHVITFRNHWKFFTRSSNGKHQMDVDEVRAAFVGSEAIAERVRAFRADRLGRVVAGEGAAALEGSARAVLHVAPLSAFDSPLPLVDLGTEDDAMRDLRPPSNGRFPRYNFDGLVSEGRHAGRGVVSYAQLFRSGVVETVDATPFLEDELTIVANELEEYTVEALKRYLRLQRVLGVSSPVAVMFSLVGVGGYSIAHSSNSPGYIRPVDRDDLVVPEVLLESGPDAEDREVGLALKGIFGAVWNACGYAESPNFYDDGRWAPSARGW